ncbi:uncharacterized protein [Watersipora subatra]|uniref:uncharacterized protein n=1 Tax=Watersipora subatra TaxID=2589382 RepID=UPI00355BC3A2
MRMKLLRSRQTQVVLLAAFSFFMIYTLVQKPPQASVQARFVPGKKRPAGLASQSKLDVPDLHIYAKELYHNNFTVEGHRFNMSGVEQLYNHTLSSSLIHSFSPYTENRFKEIMLEPRHEQRVYANSPALMWYRGELICVMRIWLEKEKYTDEGAKRPPNDFNDNFLYTQKFNKYMKPITPGSILGIPTPRQWTVGDGPIEPRLFQVDDTNVFVSFNTGVYLKNGKALDGTFVWDYLRHKTIMPSIKGGSPIMKTVEPDRMPRDKHWTPYMERGQLHMVYNLDPLRVLSCTKNFSCYFSHFEGPKGYRFVQGKDSLRGGTPWILYKYPYYYSIGHTTLFKNPSNDRIYTINIIIYRAHPVPRVVYVSGPLQINETPMNDVPIVRYNYIKDPFFFPVSIIQEDGDSLVIGGHINDYSSVLIRVRGIKRLMSEVIGHDEEKPVNMRGPPLGTLHRSTKEFASKLTKNQFFAQ